jgi:hypothetical protein
VDNDDEAALGQRQSETLLEDFTRGIPGKVIHRRRRKNQTQYISLSLSLSLSLEEEPKTRRNPSNNKQTEHWGEQTEYGGEHVGNC